MDALYIVYHMQSYQKLIWVEIQLISVAFYRLMITIRMEVHNKMVVFTLKNATQ